VPYEVHHDQQPLGRRQHAVHRHEVRVAADGEADGRLGRELHVHLRLLLGRQARLDRLDRERAAAADGRPHLVDRAERAFAEHILDDVQGFAVVHDLVARRVLRRRGRAARRRRRVEHAALHGDHRAAPALGVEQRAHRGVHARGVRVGGGRRGVAGLGGRRGVAGLVVGGRRRRGVAGLGRRRGVVGLGRPRRRGVVVGLQWRPRRGLVVGQPRRRGLAGTRGGRRPDLLVGLDLTSGLSRLVGRVHRRRARLRAAHATHLSSARL